MLSPIGWTDVRRWGFSLLWVQRLCADTEVEPWKTGREFSGRQRAVRGRDGKGATKRAEAEKFLLRI